MSSNHYHKDIEITENSSESDDDFPSHIDIQQPIKQVTDKKSGKSEKSKRYKKPNINEMSKKSQSQGKPKQQTEQKEISIESGSYEKRNYKTNEKSHRKKGDKRVERNEIFKSSEKSRMRTRKRTLRKTERPQSLYDPGKNIHNNIQSVFKITYFF